MISPTSPTEAPVQAPGKLPGLWSNRDYMLLWSGQAVSSLGTQVSTIAFPFLVEAARDTAVRKLLYTPLLQGTKDEKIYLAQVMARSGNRDDVPELEKLSHDGDPDVGKEALRALKNLQART